MSAGVKDKKMFFIINSFAGGGKAKDWWEEKQLELSAQGFDYFWEYTEGGEKTGLQVRKAVLEQGAEAVIVVGGDGALFDAVNGLIENEHLIAEDVIFVVSPAGSACDFGRHIYNGEKLDLLDLLQKGNVRHVDLGLCVYHNMQGVEKKSCFINSFDAGAGADTCLRINANQGRLKKLIHSGKLVFMLTALKVLSSFKYTHAYINVDGEEIEGEYIIIAIGNGSYMGGGMHLCGKASLDDGLLDLFLVEGRSLPKILYAFTKIFGNKTMTIDKIAYRQLKKVVIKTDKPIAIELDGEVPGVTDVEIHVLPGILPLLVPAP